MPPSSPRDGGASAVREKARLRNILRDPNASAEAPPGYFEGSSSASLPLDNSCRSRDLPDIDFGAYCIPKAKVSAEDGTTVISYDQSTLSPDSLMRLALRQVALPPKPIICIRGFTEAFQGQGPMFELKLNASSLLIRDSGDTWNYVKVVPSSASLGDNGFNFEQAVLRFCVEEASYKTLILERKVINWDTEYLEGQIRNLIASLNYVGRVEITFPVEYSKVIFQVGKEPLIKPFDTIVQWFSQKEPGKKPFKSRSNTEVQAIWPYATTAPGQSDEVPRRYAVQSEQQYWNAWRGAIANAILSKRKGWVSTEDRIEALMGVRLAPPKSQWGRWGAETS